MSDANAPEAARPLLAIDRAARDAFEPYRGTRLVRVVGWLSELGDQPQLRALSAATLAGGIVRRDPRMIGTGVRMLLAHELATLAKTAVKKRIDRTRPRSADRGEEAKPRPGGDSAKEETSFPSGHSAGGMAVACAIAARYPRHRAKALGAGGAVALAQIPRCAHYPSDVAAGLVLGAVADAVVGLFGRSARYALRR